MSDYSTVARPYAKAAFDFSAEHKCIEHWQNMISFFAEIVRNRQVGNLLSSEQTPEKLSSLFIGICGEYVDEAGKNFIKVLAENRRLALIPTILKQFIQLRHEYEKTIEVNVISSRALNSEQVEKIQAAMEKRLACNVVLNCKIDRSIIAGLVIRVGDTVIDGSLRSRIERLENFLQS